MASGDDSAPVAARPDDGASAQAQRFRDGAEAIRQRTDLTAKTFGGLATTAVSALGIAKFADVFPMPPGEWPWTSRPHRRLRAHAGGRRRLYRAPLEGERADHPALERKGDASETRRGTA